MGGRGSQGSGLLVYVCVMLVVVVCVCVCVCVSERERESVYDVAEGVEQQSSGCPDSKKGYC